MTKEMTESCIPCCDYCLYYAFNGKNGVYVGKGRCHITSPPKPAEPWEWCDDFVCAHHGDRED